MYTVQRKLLSQNFLHNRKLVAKLVGLSSITQNDVVLEIGPGKGIITEQLIQRASSVIAVELDIHWFSYLQKKFLNSHSLKLVNTDILLFPLLTKPYKIFANIPISIEAKIVRKLLEDQNPPTDCYIIVMKEFAKRLTDSNGTTLFALMYAPWFEFSILHTFQIFDFQPVPNIDIVLLRIQKRTLPLLGEKDKKRYQECIQLGFANGQPIRNNLRKKYSLLQIYNVLQKMSLSRKVKPSQLSCEEWVGLYKNLL